MKLRLEPRSERAPGVITSHLFSASEIKSKRKASSSDRGKDFRGLVETSAGSPDRFLVPFFDAAERGRVSCLLARQIEDGSRTFLPEKRPGPRAAFGAGAQLCYRAPPVVSIQN
ncbi:hypothetical protein R1flu_007467 [Riccia fluitans]|uniref:Uncharacterized protein n=1 Tax=Riccia fluitans TaxID=41844 RepID=A0ABD1YYY6_9MARC